MRRKRDSVWSERGKGSVFYWVDENGRKVSPWLYVAYRDHRHVEQVVSTKVADPELARKKLDEFTRHRENTKQSGVAPRGPKLERMRIGHLLDENLRRAERDGLASLRQIRYRTAGLKQFFGNTRVLDYAPRMARTYADARSQQGTAPASIHRELEILTAAFTFARAEGLIQQVPAVPKPVVSNVREERLTLGEVDAVLAAMRDENPDYADFAEAIFLTMRRPSEVRRLTWDRNFDRDNRSLFFPSAKGGRPTVFALEGALGELVERRIAARRLDSPHIFHRRGRAVPQEGPRDLYKSVCPKLGIDPSKVGLYGLKHSGMSEALAGGLSETQIMELSGHRTRSAFQRYAILGPEQNREALRKRDAAFAERRASVSAKTLEFPRESSEIG